MKNKFLLPLLLIIFISCKKEEKAPPTNTDLLKGSAWSLFSSHRKTQIESTKEITLDTLIISDCSMKSRLQFLDNNAVKYNDNCILIKELTLMGTWGMTADGKVFTKIDYPLSSSTGGLSLNFGFEDSEILEIDALHFVLKRINRNYFLDATGITTVFATEVISTYKKVD